MKGPSSKETDVLIPDQLQSAVGTMVGALKFLNSDGPAGTPGLCHIASNP